MELLTAEEAEAVRGWAADEFTVAPLSPRLWRPRDGGPIRAIEASGRATCRACGRKIGKGEQAILFGFDQMEGHGRVADAYMHAMCKEGNDETPGRLADSPR